MAGPTTAVVTGATNGGAGPSAGLSVYNNPYTLTGSVISDTGTNALALSSRTHCAAKHKKFVHELWYYRNSAWSLMPNQPYTSKDNHPVLTQGWRQPSNLSCTIPNAVGELTPENLESAYNYNAAGAYDPLLDEARKVMFRVGIAAYANLANGIAPTSTLAPTSGALSSLTNAVLSDYSQGSPAGVVLFNAASTTFTLKLNLGAQTYIKHSVIRFGSKTLNSMKLPVRIRIGTSPDDVTYTWRPYRPVGGDGSGAYTPGDLYENYYGVAFEIPVCDLDVTARYVQCEITTLGATNVAIDEWAIYGGSSFTYIGRNMFVGYLGDSIDTSNDGIIGLTITDATKRLNDNTSNDLVAAFYQTDATDIVYSLLTGSAFWKGQSPHNTAYGSTQVGWSSGTALSGLVYPVWQGQSSSMLGYIEELMNSIGYMFYADGNEVWQKFDPPYRQTAPNRVMIADTDGNGDVRNIVRRRTGKSMRNAVTIVPGKSSHANTGPLTSFEPNSVARFAERKNKITDPILQTTELRQKVAQYFLRDFAWRLQTLHCQIAPDFETRVRDYHAFRASFRPQVFARGCAVTKNRRATEAWVLETISHHFTVGDWYGECEYMPYFPFGTDSPVHNSLLTNSGLADIISNYSMPSDPLAIGAKVYISAVGETTGFVQAIYLAGPLSSPVTTSFSNTYYDPAGGAHTITVGNRYWVYVTAVNQMGYESLPSQVLNVIAGSGVIVGTDCNGSGTGSGYVISDFTVGSVSVSAIDLNGDYTYVFYATWTSPFCGHTQHRIVVNPYRLPSAETPARVDTNDADWLWRNDKWNWWAPDRILAGKMWDNTTNGLLDFTITFKTKTLFTATQKVYFRIFNSKMTRDWRPSPGNYTFVTF